ncbi:MAG: BlaI/MecI/CopY family transcriptional regulator [Bacteroidales bacterium]
MKQEKTNIKPTGSELEILTILWENGPMTVRSVNERLNLKKDVGYTTTLKILQIMTEKNLVSRRLENRTHIYSAIAGKEETRKAMLDSLLETAFGGSAMKMVMQALGNHNATREELEDLRKLIDRIEKKEEDAIY